MNILEHVPLRDHTTFRIGGEARFFIEAHTLEELKDAIRWSHEKKVPFFVLGGGSNILVSDKGIPGLVIKNELRGIETSDRDDDRVEVCAGAGEEWDAFVAYTVSQNFGGLENLSGIPGKVGAAPVQNIGAYGSEVKDTIVWVEALDSSSQTTKRFSNEECLFGYRFSTFKKPENKKYIITRVAHRLSRNPVPDVRYKDLQEYFAAHSLSSPTVKAVRDAVLSIRSRKLPDITKLGTAGSFFKNPIVALSVYEEIRSRFPDIPSYPVNDKEVKVPAAWLIDKVCHIKGVRQGNVGTYHNQALVVVNYGNAKAQEVKQFTDFIIRSVKEKTGITLMPEVELVGEF
jgi:UDP-N-acetylmuramate dehydrogenase